MTLIKNDHWVYISWYYHWEFKNKTPKCDFRISLAETPAWRVYAYWMSSSTQWMWTPLMDGWWQSRQEAILCALRQLYKKFADIGKMDKVLKVIEMFANDHKSNPDDHFKAHFTLQVLEEETQEENIELPSKEIKTKKETKSDTVVANANGNKTEDKAQQFKVWDKVKCIDTWWLNSLFLWKEYEVEWIHTALVGKNNYEQIRVYGLLYSVKYFILVD